LISGSARFRVSFARFRAEALIMAAKPPPVAPKAVQAAAPPKALPAEPAREPRRTPFPLARPVSVGAPHRRGAPADT
jgi:hypothetical protein